jgi:uncharacterized protein (DUF1330 family)
LLQQISKRFSQSDLGCSELLRRLLIVEFADKAAAKAFLDDPEYQPIKDIRLGAATSLMVIGTSEM